MNKTLRVHVPGIYRVTLSGDRFGQIKRDGREWIAEVRDTNTGTLMRFAGLWKTRKDAFEELVTINPLDL
jgi:hypothetical protein